MQKIIKSNILLSLIEDSYRAEYTEWERRNLRFSDAGIAAKDGQKCERQIYYDIYTSDQKSLLTSGSLVLFDDGRLHEQDIRRRLRTILRSPEREVNDLETGARGKIDNTIYKGQIKELPWGADAKELHDDPGLEIKSVNQFQYQEMAVDGQIEQSYYDQIQMYLYATSLPFFICLIKNRNSMGQEKGEMPYLEFIVLPDTQRQAELHAGFKTTKQALDKQILPPRPFLRESTQCQFCRYKHVCWELKVEQEKIQRQLEGEVPRQEVFETALKTYAATNKQLSEIKKFNDEAKAIILQYFKATGKDQAEVENIKATYSQRTTKEWDLDYLCENLSWQQQLLISEPSEEKLKQAIEDRKIDASVLEKAIKTVPAGFTLRVTVAKTTESDRQSVLQIKGEKNGRGKRLVNKKLTPSPANGKPGKRLVNKKLTPSPANGKPGKSSGNSKQHKGKLLKALKGK